MSAESVRRFYGVPAKVGMRITFCGKGATIVGFDRSQMYLRLRIDGEKGIACAHPTWAIEYPTDGAS
jgi:hypothetical protein